jgi:SAM-dependent methyltransferase
MSPGDSRRIQRLSEDFDASVEREWLRYAGEPRRQLLRVLRERFLRLHLTGRSGRLLELGPGPGRFSPLTRAPAKVRLAVGVDLSREGLRAARRRARRDPAGGKARWVRAAGESLPFPPETFHVSVVFGNIVGMAAGSADRVLAEQHRVLRPGGLLLVDFASPTGAIQEFLSSAARRRFLPRVLRRPSYYLVDDVLATGRQRYAPKRLARWDFQFFTPARAREALAAGGFEIEDEMAVAPVAAFQPSVAAIARRDPHTWSNLLRLEEEIGRRPGVLETGQGFLVAARKRRRGALHRGPAVRKGFR